LRFTLVFILFHLLVCFAPAAPSSATGVISGWVKAGSEDAQGNVLTVEIVVGEGAQEEPYLVTGPKLTELKALVGEWVVASGTISEDTLGWKSILVERFTRIDDLQQPDEPPK